MDNKINFFEFLKKLLPSFFVNSFVITIFGIGFIPYYIFYSIFSVFIIEENVNIVLSVCITLFMVLIYSAFDIAKDLAKDLAISSSEAIKYNNSLRNEANNYYSIKKAEANNFFNISIEEIKKVVEDKKINKPYLAKIYSDYIYYLDMKVANNLIIKKNPAYKASEEVKMIAKEKRNLFNQLKLVQYQLSVYENALPWLEEFKEINIEELDELIEIDDDKKDEYDSLKNYLSPEEYKKLPLAQKYQLALERYRISNKKTNWQVGIDFERYSGYIYEQKGYRVTYNGALKKLEDLGRDLIATKKDEMVIIQCKYWSKQKTIHEKHIFQLYGTMITCKIDNPDKDVKAVFITTTCLSEKAKKIAEILCIRVCENIEYDKKYPCIKCNISKKDGTKIYHLPFDQQYDRITIEKEKGQFYANTVFEAEEKGFRRAYKWISAENN
jgi:hypothetical protein